MALLGQFNQGDGPLLMIQWSGGRMFPKIDATFEDGFHMDLCNKRSTPAPPSVLAAGTPTIRGSLTTGAKTNSIIAVSPSVSRYIHRVHTYVVLPHVTSGWLAPCFYPCGSSQTSKGRRHRFCLFLSRDGAAQEYLTLPYRSNPADSSCTQPNEHRHLT